MTYLKKYRADVKYGYFNHQKETTIEFFAKDESDAKRKIAKFEKNEMRIGYQFEDLSPRFSNIREVK